MGSVEAWPTPVPLPSPSSPTRRAAAVDEEAPLRPVGEEARIKGAAASPPFGVLSVHPGLDGAIVRGCWLRLAGLFRSRVRSLPNAEVARLFDERARALGE